MHKLIFLIFLLSIFHSACKQQARTTKGSAELVPAIAFYFEGRKNGDVELLKTIFHPKARLLTIDPGLKIITLPEYLDVVKKQGAIACKTTIERLEVDGQRAFAKTKFDYGKKVYEDYLTLLKIEGKWWIVNKTFERLE